LTGEVDAVLEKRIRILPDVELASLLGSSLGSSRFQVSAVERWLMRARGISSTLAITKKELPGMLNSVRAFRVRFWVSWFSYYGEFKNIHHHRIWAWRNEKMAGVDNFLVYVQTAVEHNTYYIHHPGGAACPRGGVYTNCVLYSSLHIRPEMADTSHVLIFPWPKPGGGEKQGFQNRVCLVGKTLVDTVGVLCPILEPTNAHIRQNPKNDRK